MLIKRVSLLFAIGLLIGISSPSIGLCSKELLENQPIDSPTAIALSPDERFLVIGRRGSLDIVDSQTNQLLAHSQFPFFQQHFKMVNESGPHVAKDFIETHQIVFAQNGEFVSAHGLDGGYAFLRWKFSDGHLSYLRGFSFLQNGFARKASVSRDGRTGITQNGSKVFFWDLENTNPPVPWKETQENGQGIWTVDIPNGSAAPLKANLERAWEGRPADVSNVMDIVSLSKKDRFLLTAPNFRGEHIYLWDLENLNERRNSKPKILTGALNSDPRILIKAIAFSPHQTDLAVAIIDSMLIMIPDVINMPESRLGYALEGEMTGDVHLAFFEKGKKLMITHRTYGRNNWISVWNLLLNKEVFRMDLKHRRPNQGVLSSGHTSGDGAKLYVPFPDENKVEMFDVFTGSAEFPKSTRP